MGFGIYSTVLTLIAFTEITSVVCTTMKSVRISPQNDP